jgi:ferredoxin
VSSSLRVRIDPDVCVGTGMCEATSAVLFAVTDAGTARVLVGEVPPALVAAAREAAANCPTRALALEES